MNKKNLIYIILKFVPFLMGVTLYSIKIVNLFSSLLLFLGGYVFIKNILDYRIIKKNIASIYEGRKKINNSGEGKEFSKGMGISNGLKIRNDNIVSNINDIEEVDVSSKLDEHDSLLEFGGRVKRKVRTRLKKR